MDNLCDNLDKLNIKSDKEKIIELFNENVYGKKYNENKKHSGAEGHWLENLFGIKSNCKNEPDIFGYELKKDSKKITFGDFSASEYLFSKNSGIISRKEYIEYFGEPNKIKNNRYSWSGSCVPKYGEYNNYGQILLIEDNNLIIYYSYSKDNRERKENFPEKIKKDNLLIAKWTKEKLSKHINNKFNNKGFFICKKNNDGIYNEILFGKPFNYEYFLEGIKKKLIIFDSGMYEGNSRNYSHFRSYNKLFWSQLLDNN